MVTYPISQMPFLSERLGAVRCARIGYLDRMNPWRQAGATNLKNTVIDLMQGRRPTDVACPVSDVIGGISRLNHANGKDNYRPLSMTRLYTILQCMPLINTREVMTMFDVGDRQARRYVKACKLIIKCLEKQAIENPSVPDGH
ncbi:hypothetical protein [Larsenimonas suaedae]|uniref:Uncharacterized protein n=1 Tax=Larsenimonas suaedae TaxID=1851019 RepID=A0ABU1GZ27_9GAMM|nr:hypothetical protein [Larsenimonas suaedae]MCM2973796.1 hypothetical protein [Larsenimonas suaedae]MDR5897320.1 hypothetical protein [Larsenimonas suaedae]